MKTLIASRSPLLTQGIKGLLTQPSNSATSVCDMLSLYRHLRTNEAPILVIIDACLPGLESYNRLLDLARKEGVRVFLLTDSVDEVRMRRAVFHGVSGIASKTTALDELAQAIKHVQAGGCWYYGLTSLKALPDQSKGCPEYALYRLSRQESRVLKLVLEGLRNKEIARVLSLTEHTVKTHMSNILRKLETDNRTRLVVALKQAGIRSLSA